MANLQTVAHWRDAGAQQSGGLVGSKSGLHFSAEEMPSICRGLDGPRAAVLTGAMSSRRTRRLRIFCEERIWGDYSIDDLPISPGVKERMLAWA